jgi:hypothetical protein
VEPADSAWWQVQCGFSDDCPPGRKIGHFQISTFSTVSVNNTHSRCRAIGPGMRRRIDLRPRMAAMRRITDLRRPGRQRPGSAIYGHWWSPQRTPASSLFCSLMSQWLWLGFERQVTFGCLRSLRAPGHLMGSAGCGAAWLKPQSAKSAGRVRQNRRRHPLPPSGVAPAREFVSVSFLPGARVRRT